MRKLTIFATLAVLLLAVCAQADVTVTNGSSAGWVQISPNTFGLPANLSGIGCGTENETICEPVGVFNFNIAFAGSGAWNILDTDSATGQLALSDQIQYFNGPSGLGVVLFYSDPNLANALPDVPTLCIESFAAPTDPGPGGCVAPFTILAADGSVITLTAASDSEHVFDPFGLGADSSDELQVTGGAHIVPGVPEPGTMMLFGSGLFGLAGTIRRKFLR